MEEFQTDAIIIINNKILYLLYKCYVKENILQLL